MAVIFDFQVNLREYSLEEMLASQTSTLHIGLDSFGALRHDELLHVGAGYISTFLYGRSWKDILLSEVFHLDGYAVADFVAPELDCHSKAGIARSVANLVAHARLFDAKVQKAGRTSLTR
jgi:hypothetical protein